MRPFGLAYMHIWPQSSEIWHLRSGIRDLDSPWVVVGGVADHVHILFDIGKMVAPVLHVNMAFGQIRHGFRFLGRRFSSLRSPSLAPGYDEIRPSA